MLLTAPPGSLPCWPWSGHPPGGNGGARGRAGGYSRTMDLTYPADSRSRSGPRSAGGWRTTSPRAGATPGFSMTPDEKQGLQPGVDEEALRRRLDLRLVAQGVRRQGPVPHGAGRAQRGVRPGRGAAAGRLLRRHPGRPDHPAVGHRGAEAAVHPRDPQRQHRLVPGLLASPTPAATWPRLKTRAELDGDEWVINGQKVWTTQAQFADYIFLLARTDPDAPKHAGISYLLVPMKQPGIEVRPIAQVDGSRRVQRGLLHQRPLPRRRTWSAGSTTAGRWP